MSATPTVSLYSVPVTRRMKAARDPGDCSADCRRDTCVVIVVSAVQKGKGGGGDQRAKDGGGEGQ